MPSPIIIFAIHNSFIYIPIQCMYLIAKLPQCHRLLLFLRDIDAPIERPLGMKLSPVFSLGASGGGGGSPTRKPPPDKKYLKK